MASAIIHIAIAKEVNKRLKKDESKYLLGSIAPDIAKLVGEPKNKSHFMDEGHSEPNLDRFLEKYECYLDDDFVMGYYIHLLGDYFWFKYFIPEIVNEDNTLIKNLAGEKVHLCDDAIMEYIYNDYTSLNIDLIDKYKLDLDIFYQDIPKLDNIIEEIPMDKLEILRDKMGLIIESSKKAKLYVFSMENIENFISTTTEMIIAKLEELDYL